MRIAQRRARIEEKELLQDRICAHAYTVSINENHLVDVLHHTRGKAQLAAPCL